MRSGRADQRYNRRGTDRQGLPRRHDGGAGVAEDEGEYCSRLCTYTFDMRFHAFLLLTRHLPLVLSVPLLESVPQQSPLPLRVGGVVDVQVDCACTFRLSAFQGGVLSRSPSNRPSSFPGNIYNYNLKVVFIGAAGTGTSVHSMLPSQWPSVYTSIITYSADCLLYDVLQARQRLFTGS